MVTTIDIREVTGIEVEGLDARNTPSRSIMIKTKTGDTEILLWSEDAEALQIKI